MNKDLIKIPVHIEATIIRRINKFTVEVKINDKTEIAYTNNTGRLTQYIKKGKKAYLIKNPKPKKTKYRILAVEDHGEAAIIDTQIQMKAFEKALEKQLIPWLKNSRIIKRNVKVVDSVIDYLIQTPQGPALLEVKSALQRIRETTASYPDCPTKRGRKHIKQLTKHVKDGGQAIILFIAPQPKITQFKPNKQVDPKITQLLKEAQKTGVKIKAINIHYSPKTRTIKITNPNLKIN